MFRSGSPSNLFRKDLSGAGAEECVATSGNTRWPTDWSRDGRALLYYELAPGTNRDFWVLSMTPGRYEAYVQAYP